MEALDTGTPPAEDTAAWLAAMTKPSAADVPVDQRETLEAIRARRIAASKPNRSRQATATATPSGEDVKTDIRAALSSPHGCTVVHFDDPHKLGTRGQGAAWSPNGESLLTFKPDGSARLYKQSSTIPVPAYLHLPAGFHPHAVAWSSDQLNLYCAASDGTILALFKMDVSWLEQKPLSGNISIQSTIVLTSKLSSAKSLILHPDGHLLAYHTDEKIFVYDLDTKDFFSTTFYVNTPLRLMWSNANDQLLYTAYGEVCSWDFRKRLGLIKTLAVGTGPFAICKGTKQTRSTKRSYSARNRHCRFNVGDLVVHPTNSSDNRLVLKSLADTAPDQIISETGSFIKKLAWEPHTGLLAVSCEDRHGPDYLSLRDIRHQSAPLARLKGHPDKLYWSPDGRALLVADKEDRLTLLKLTEPAIAVQNTVADSKSDIAACDDRQSYAKLS